METRHFGEKGEIPKYPDARFLWRKRNYGVRLKSGQKSADNIPADTIYNNDSLGSCRSWNWKTPFLEMLYIIVLISQSKFGLQ